MDSVRNQLDYETVDPAMERPQAGVGIASVVIGIFFFFLGTVFFFDILEALDVQFYGYSIVFCTGFVLGVWALLLPFRRRKAAWLGLFINALGFTWVVGHLYKVMVLCAGRGWMRMPWPF